MIVLNGPSIGSPTSQSLPVAIVAADAVVCSFDRSLYSATFNVRVIASEHDVIAAALCNEIPCEQRAARLPCHLQPQIQVVFVAVPDAAFSPELSSAIRNSLPEALVALHTSGSPASALTGSAQNTLAFQPAAPFPSGTGAAMTSLRALFPALEEGDEMVPFGVRLADLLAMRPFRLRQAADGKRLYHAVCCNQQLHRRHAVRGQ
jgi:hypothetical protein